MADTYYCEKCNRTMGAEQFYSSNNLEKYPNDGKFPQCKKCITMHVDNWNPDTYLWIIQEADGRVRVWDVDFPGCCEETFFGKEDEFIYEKVADNEYVQVTM